MPKIDFTGVGEPLPQDEYTCVVSKAAFNAASKSSGQPTVAFEWTVSEGQYEGRKLFRSYSLQPSALVFLKQALIAMGVDPDDLSSEIDIDQICTDVLGNECVLEVTIGEYNGNPNNQVARIKQAGVGAF